MSASTGRNRLLRHALFLLIIENRSIRAADKPESKRRSCFMSSFIFENTWEENQEAMKTRKLAIIPVGSSEQHGPALPVGTDWIIAEYLAKRVGEKNRQRTCGARRSLWTRTLSCRLPRNHGCFPDYSCRLHTGGLRSACFLWLYPFLILKWTWRQ